MKSHWKGLRDELLVLFAFFFVLALIAVRLYLSSHDWTR